MTDDNRAVDTTTRLAPPPPSPVWELPLRVTLYSRALALLRGLLPLLLLGGGALLALFDPRSEPPDPSFLSLAASWHAIVAVCCLLLLLMRPAFARRAHLRVDPGGVTIDHGGVLRRPLRIPKEEIKLAAADTTSRPRRFQIGSRDHRRFPITAPRAYQGPPLPEWLYSRVGSSPFPLISHLGDPPNVVLLLEHPVTLSWARRTIKILAAKGPVHVARPSQKTQGLMLRVVHPDRARAAFHQHELLGEVTARDVLAVGPGQEQYERARTYNTRANLLVGAIIMLNFGPIMLFVGIGPAS